MKILDKATRMETTVEPDPMEKVNQKLAKAGQSLAQGISEAVEAISLWGRTVFAPALKKLVQEGQKLSKRNKVRGEKLALIRKASSYGLSERVISLCGHRKARVRKKNLNRLKKEVLRYERSRRNTRGQEAGEPPKGHAGDCQPDELVPGKAGGPEPNG